MISYHYTLYYPQHFQLTFRRKYMYLQHDCYSHRFMKFPEKCKISPTDLQFPKLALVMIPNHPHNHPLQQNIHAFSKPHARPADELIGP